MSSSRPPARGGTSGRASSSSSRALVPRDTSPMLALYRRYRGRFRTPSHSANRASSESDSSAAVSRAYSRALAVLAQDRETRDSVQPGTSLPPEGTNATKTNEAMDSFVAAFPALVEHIVFLHVRGLHLARRQLFAEKRSGCGSKLRAFATQNKSGRAT